MQINLLNPQAILFKMALEQIIGSILSLLSTIYIASTLVRAQGGVMANIPGGQTASAALASSADGLSRYLAPDGPIQPAITAIGTLPVRAVERINNGISRISSGLDDGAQSLSNAAGQEGNIRMPGMDALESSMPASFASLGNMMHGAIQQKNKFIAGQAEAGVQAGEHLRSMMENGLQGFKDRSSSPMAGMGKMVGSAHESLMSGASQIQDQLKQSLQGHMGRMQSMHGIGENMRNQVHGMGQTLTSGLQGAASSLQRTHDQLRGQIHGGMQKNMGAMSGIMDSMHGSMGNMGQNMQKNLQGVMEHAQNTAQQLTSHLHQAAQGPLEMISSLGSSLGSLMPSGGGMNVQASRNKGRY